MSDTDNESAFESADEGDDINQQQAVVHQQLAATSSQKPACSDHENISNMSSSFSSAIPAAAEFVENVTLPALLTETERKLDTNEPSAASEVSELSAGPCQLDDEGLGDWDAGWEVEEDVLAAVQGEPDENVEKLLANQDVVHQAEGLTIREGSAESRTRESAPARKIESSSKEKVLDKLCEASGQQSVQGWGWGSWGNSILSTASSSVATFTTQVGHGLNSVLESVEATLGAPTPEELAAQHSMSKESQSEHQSVTATSNDQKSPSSSFLGSHLAHSVGKVSSKVFAGSLGTLELIGRKTMDILQEGDPGFKKKRSFLRGEKPVLSEVLREAKEREIGINLAQTEDNQRENRVHFGTIFDDCQGLVHLEALEMLSTQSEQKVQVALLSLMDDELKAMQKELENFKEIYESETDVDPDENSNQEFDRLLLQYLKNLNVDFNIEKLEKAQSDSQSWLMQCCNDQDKGIRKDAKEIHAKAISFMAEFTARAVEVIHKTSELTIVMNNVNVSQAIHNFASFANVLCTELAIQSSKYSSCLTNEADCSEEPDSVNPLITNVFLEASNSSTYIQDACQLLLPVFQLKHVTAANSKDA